MLLLGRALDGELHVAVDQCKQGVVLAHAHVVTGVHARAALADDDAAGVMAWPPNTFTPRRFDSESRPFRVEPPPFFCAMSYSCRFTGLRSNDQALIASMRSSV
ncbi:hypothetical protein AWV79_21910 [Cupriavidus sp. UYMMa02A]|nr:hypothetical protein AWV79_21910 [Cupriavidus sp. UYMMa02A]